MLQNAIGNGNAMIIFTKRGSLVNNTRSIRVRHVGINDNPESLVFELIIMDINNATGRKTL